LAGRAGRSHQELAARLTGLAVRAAGLLLRISVGLLIFCLFALVASQVVDRHLVRLWHVDSAEEYVKVGIVWLTFIGLAAAMADGETVRVEALRNALPPAFRRVLDLVFDLAVLAVLVITLWYGWRVFEVGQYQTILGTDFTLAVPIAGLLLGFAACVLVVAARVVRLVRVG
jgi:TRAP-type C4-dicarboxylate transport system permease small subunit